tara:strand:- start:715 stop:1080 length:366 start_codon:yes stop_codon:yes gene_type:complete
MKIYSEKPMEMFFDGLNPMLKKEGSPLEFNLLDTLKHKISFTGYVLIDYTTPSQADLGCPMTIPNGMVICRNRNFDEFVVWRYGVQIVESNFVTDLEVNLNHGDYCKDLISAVKRYEERQR